MDYENYIFDCLYVNLLVKEQMEEFQYEINEKLTLLQEIKSQYLSSITSV